MFYSTIDEPYYTQVTTEWSEYSIEIKYYI